MYVTFKAYLKEVKRSFKEHRYEQDMQYRAVLFHQFGESFHILCKRKNIASDYEDIAYDVRMFEKRLERYRNA